MGVGLLDRVDEEQVDTFSYLPDAVRRRAGTGEIVPATVADAAPRYVETCSTSVT